MRRIAHLSDLHFGTVDQSMAEALLVDLGEQRPQLVVVSGDLTQRARRSQFRMARAWLQRVPAPLLVVPGNHDVPLYDVTRRFLRPLERYRRYISRDLMPFHDDGELAVLGINTARSFTWKSGRISHQQMAGIRRRLGALPADRFKVVVTHHEFVPPAGARFTGVVGRAARALEVLEDCQVDLLLAGHLHQGYTADISAHYPARKRSIVVAQASTALSSRLRGEPNSYNLIETSDDGFSITVRSHLESAFSATDHARFVRHEGGGWRQDEAPE
jgi:3',5'-cyclic AMP phosphodiesterase CpdA